ncbi:MAG: hypothetical protein RLZZ385_652, partial [Pseudomonadota bacterium]
NTVLAQQENDEDRIVRVEEIVVQGSIGYRNRREDAMATLEYGQDYIQRFEPLTAGDALKRMPSVTFLSDVIESDGVRLRGLDPGYTKILINGDPVPGTNADRSFFMDRIPAELIDRVEIVRSNSARRSGDAVAGTLNIVLRDGYSLDGGYIRAGGLRFDDGEWKESAAGVWGGEVGNGRLIVGANLQGRYNPKLKSSLRFGDSPENNPAFATEDFDNREDQTDTRDGTDTSFNATYQVDLGADTELELSGFYVTTDRTETERSFEYDSRTAITGPVPTGNMLTDNDNINQIDQSNYNLRVALETESDLGETEFKLSFASNDQGEYETEDEVDFDRSTPRYTGDLTVTDIVDEELSFDLQHEFDLGNNMEFALGGFWQSKDRDTNIRDQRNRFNVAAAGTGYDQFSRNPKEFRAAWNNLQAITGGFSTIEEDRLDVFGALEGAGDRIAWEMGLRWESTDVTINDKEIPRTQDMDYDFLLPSAHIRYDLTNVDRLTGSIARTVRRPNFNFVSPALLEAELGDNDLLGNPLLEPETAWGYDIGYEHRIGTAGVVGINYFWRDVSDLIEVANTGVEGSEGPGTFVYTPRNTGDGEVSGIEFDMSTPLSAFGMDNTGVFLNYSWLDSEVNDEFGPRTFNDQSEFVYNFGFIQDLPAMQAAFGATYRKQDDAWGRVTAEEVTTSYGAEMELFVEKSFGERITLRLVGSNLLDGSKDETFNKFATTGDQISRDFDEYELESESAGPWYQLMVRIAL